jgi:hypothetical protein
METLNKTLTLDGITYAVLSEKPYEYNGYKRVSITLKRPRGRRTYVAIRYENGCYSSVV